MKKNDPIVRACAYCQHARISDDNESATPPFVRLLTFTADLENGVLFCPYKKSITPASKCHRFRFDAVKYRPKPKPAPILLSEDDIL